MAGTNPSLRTLRPKTTGAARTSTNPRHGTGPNGWFCDAKEEAMMIAPNSIKMTDKRSGKYPGPMRKAEPVSRLRAPSAKAAPITKKIAPAAASRRFSLSIRHPQNDPVPPNRRQRGENASVGELASSRDDRPPAFDLARQLFLQGGWSRLILGRRRGAKLGKALADGFILQGFLQGLGETIDHVLRGPLRRIEAVPDGDLKARKTCFGSRWNVGQVRQALLRGGGVGLNLSSLDLVGGVGGLVAHEIHLAANEVGQGRSRSLVGHGGHGGAYFAHEQHAAQMRCSSDPGVGVGDRVLVSLYIIDQAFEVGRLQIFLSHQNHRHVGDETDIFEVLERVEGKLAIEGGRSRHADVVKEQRIAIRLGLGHARGTKRAPGPADVLDDHLLSQVTAHR